MKYINNEILTETYNKERSVWKTGKRLGISGQAAHDRLMKLGIVMNGAGNKWLETDTERLKREYISYRDSGTLNELANQMGRTKYFICRKAKEIGLTNGNHAKHYLSKWKYMLKEEAELIWNNFKKSSLGMCKYCKVKGLDDLGFARTMKKYFMDEYEHVLELKIPKQSLYRYGRQLEYKCRDLLKEKGYFVIRSPQSKSPLDLVALKKGTILFVQCKRDGRLCVKEWNDLYKIAESVNAKPLLASTETGRGIIIYELIDLKDGSKKRQPYIKLDIAQL